MVGSGDEIDKSITSEGVGWCVEFTGNTAVCLGAVGLNRALVFAWATTAEFSDSSRVAQSSQLHSDTGFEIEGDAVARDAVEDAETEVAGRGTVELAMTGEDAWAEPDIEALRE